MQAELLAYWLAAFYMPGVGAKTWQTWLQHFPSIQHCFQATAGEWLSAGIASKHHRYLQKPNWAEVDKALQWQREDQHILCLDDERYPLSLKTLHDPPLILFVKGNVDVLSQSQLAIVGARHATPHGLQNAHAFAEALAANKVVITSGLALGIDAAAHHGALQAGGHTVAVLGSGLGHIYPQANSSLAQKIVASDGALVSEFSVDMPPRAYQFPQRNRIIAGLSLGVLVVEAALKSGSLITARLGLEAGKEIFAIPGSIHNTLAKGCHALIRDGAKLTESVTDILEELPGFVLKEVRNSREAVNLTTAQAEILSYIDYAVTTIDMIISRSALTYGAVSSMLLNLEMLGQIQTVPGGYMRL